LLLRPTTIALPPTHATRAFKMGQNPSSASRPAGQAPSSQILTHDFPRHPKRDSKSLPIPATHRVAAPPEPSQIQAQGQTSGRSKNLTSITNASLTGSSPSSSSNSSAIAPAKPSDSKIIPRHEPSKPVDVPLSHTESSSLRVPYGAHVVEVPLVSHGSVGDMSYLTHPPRMPLPIEEEIHTPGSPISTAADTGDALEQDVEALDSDNMTRKSSGLSTTTVDEDDLEELSVDRTRPTVPTRLEWHRGGDKVYVTGTIFQWNRKQRLHPV
jgi:Glycogen recognition site of AMP-activated protein kinase